MKKICAYILLIALIFNITSCIRKVTTTSVETDEYIYFENVEYGKNKRHYLDICVPKNKSGNVGVMLYIHGGGWISGDKEVYTDMLKENAERGYITAALNYRYANGNRVTCEDILDDIQKSVEKIKSLAGEYNLNANKLMLLGGSAGAHLALMYAYTRAEASSITPTAVVSYAGPTDLCDENFYTTQYVDDIKEMISMISGVKLKRSSVSGNSEELLAASPIKYINEDCVPTLICHGKKDDVVPYSNAVALDATLTMYGVEHDFISFPNSGHGLEADSEMSELANELILEYAEMYIK